MAPKSRKQGKGLKTAPVAQPAPAGPEVDTDTLGPTPALPTTNPTLSGFTPERFEAELKALAAKAKQETSTKATTDQLFVYLRSLTLITLLAIYVVVFELSLSPVYGSIPPKIHDFKLLVVTCFVAWSSNLWLQRTLPVKPQLLIPVVAAYIPVVQFFLFKISSTLGATWGPAITESLTLVPLMFLSVACTATYLDGADLSRLPKSVADSVPGLGSALVYVVTAGMASSWIQRHIGTAWYLTRLGMQAILTASYSLFAPSRLLLFAIPGLLHTAIFNNHMPTSLALSSLNSTLNAHEYMILDRRESLTGYISVVESIAQGFRVLRCDHSLLGGEWTKLRTLPQFRKNQVAEPIYGVFAMLEAVRLVEVPDPVLDDQAKALVIGMGIGTTPSALVAHGIGTTVVEIDPVVRDFAQQYFHLPSNLSTVVEDAVTYASRLASSTETASFDYIVHDVFTGGAEPVALFTLEFLRDLAALLRPNGVIAINYAGDFALASPAVVVRTIREVFPSCRIFREHPRDEALVEKTGSDFTNMVIFCTKLSEPISFRKPTQRDLLNSPSREAFLLPKNEVKDEDFLVGREEGVLFRNDTDKLEKWHQTSALGHWAIMRTVLPDAVWENW
ncbi:hypothetical protein DL546_008746 [Coniochaeta pulveracea]|uniref:PABS domain-containing protein n=1 Tax=Coniochaeta pulveracea TaxID=177199 RepID=A0A420YMN9_9PEZI|nr:hypothetical protein DL546_008746 [Coniochaeta pulveracea]